MDRPGKNPVANNGIGPNTSFSTASPSRIHTAPNQPDAGERRGEEVHRLLVGRRSPVRSSPVSEKLGYENPLGDICRRAKTPYPALP